MPKLGLNQFVVYRRLQSSMERDMICIPSVNCPSLVLWRIVTIHRRAWNYLVEVRAEIWIAMNFYFPVEESNSNSRTYIYGSATGVWWTIGNLGINSYSDVSFPFFLIWLFRSCGVAKGMVFNLFSWPLCTSFRLFFWCQRKNGVKL